MSGLAIRQTDAPGLGRLYGPAGDTQAPAVLLLHGSEGGLGWMLHREAVVFAAHGFLALPYNYAVGGNYWIGGDIVMTDLDRTEATLSQLKVHPACTGRVGVYGWSRGAEHALLLTALLAQARSPFLPAAVAAHTPPDEVQSAWRNLYGRRPNPDSARAPEWSYARDKAGEATPAWSWRGQPIPPGRPIEIERYDGPIFLSVGEEDEMWPAAMTHRLAVRLAAAGRRPELHAYPGQGRLPDADGWNLHFERLLAFFEASLA